jgi:hypothetical protein
MMQHATDSNSIRHRAYELWLERGSPDGSPDYDWEKAERELLAVTTASPVAAPESSAPAPIVRKPRRARAIVTRSAAPAGDALRALAPEAAAESLNAESLNAESLIPESLIPESLIPESAGPQSQIAPSEVRQKAAPRARRAAQKRSA